MIDKLQILAYFSLAILLAINVIGTMGFAQNNESNGIDKELPPIDQKEYEEIRTATFALGCFWGVDARFGAVPGVIRTRSGYAGGTKESPTYYSLGDHTESVQVDYNSGTVLFRDLVNIFWEYHNPTYKNMSTQYANILFYHNEGQKEVAEETREKLSQELEKDIFTQIRDIDRFYPAEDYHQKYILRRNSIFVNELKDFYPQPDDLRDSTAAARLNGYLAGHGTAEEVQRVADKLGLSSKAKERLLNKFGF